MSYNVAVQGVNSVPPSGASQLLNQYINNKYEENYVQTIAADFIKNKSSGIGYRDLASNPSFKSVTDSYIRDCQAFIYVYSITDAVDNQSLIEKIEYVRKLNSNIAIYLIGSKLDLVEENSEQRKVTAEDMRTFAHIHSLTFLGEVSAKTGQRVQEALDQVIQEEISNQQSNQEQKPQEPSASLWLKAMSSSCTPIVGGIIAIAGIAAIAAGACGILGIIIVLSAFASTALIAGGVTAMGIGFGLSLFALNTRKKLSDNSEPQFQETCPLN